MKRIYLLSLMAVLSFPLIYCGEGSPSSPTTTTSSSTISSTTTSVPEKPVVIRETGDGFDTIGEAIDAAVAGQHIDVYAGTYEENLAIEKQIFLIGEDENATIIDGGKSASTVAFKSGSEGSEIRGFTITHGDGGVSSGISCGDASVTIGKNIVKDNNNNGITTYGNVFINGAIVKNNENRGIDLRGEGRRPVLSEVTVRENYFIGIGCVAASSSVSASTVEENYRYGVYCCNYDTDFGGGSQGSSGHNVIRKNGDWDFYNDTKDEVKAKNNYWDHTTAATIDFFDIYDDDETAGGSGAVDFEPFLTNPPIASLRMKPRLLTAFSLFKDFFRSLFRSDLPASAIYTPSSFEPKIHITRFELIRARYRPLADELYYPPLMLRAGR